MFFGVGDQCLTIIPKTKLYKTSLSRGHKFKYLGHLLNADLGDDEDIERERRALSFKTNVKITLFSVYCIYFYA